VNDQNKKKDEQKDDNIHGSIGFSSQNPDLATRTATMWNSLNIFRKVEIDGNTRHASPSP